MTGSKARAAPRFGVASDMIGMFARRFRATHGGGPFEADGFSPFGIGNDRHPVTAENSAEDHCRRAQSSEFDRGRSMACNTSAIGERQPRLPYHARSRVALGRHGTDDLRIFNDSRNDRASFGREELFKNRQIGPRPLRKEVRDACSFSARPPELPRRGACAQVNDVCAVDRGAFTTV